MEIVPAIIAKNFQELEGKIKLIEPYVSRAQLDISDGKFTKEETWSNPEELKKLNTNLSLEAHLMISEPEKVIDGWISSGVKRILIHFESTEKIEEIYKKIKAAGLEMGLVLALQTPISVLGNLPIPAKDLAIVQLMGISEIGFYGHPFDERVISKIFSLRAQYPDIEIAVDGGINKETASKAIGASADILISGSAIFGAGDVGQAIEELKRSVI
ncbi:MAG: hypothetical protein HY764_00795 [Candidatus Portnoybacteria bacterium]|nr:hypothetical protein [Candidatus Portnoybacteria bacterium]